MHYANIEGLTFFFFFIFLYGFLGFAHHHLFSIFAQSDYNILTSGEMVGLVATQYIEDMCGTVGTPGICTLESF